MRKIIFVLILVSILAFIVGCAPAAVEQSSAKEAPDSALVEIKDFSFNPDTVTIKRGGIVTWINRDAVTHDVTINNEEGQDVAPGQSFEKTFEKTGEYSYFCDIHTYMTGKIIVK